MSADEGGKRLAVSDAATELEEFDGAIDRLIDKTVSGACICFKITVRAFNSRTKTTEAEAITMTLYLPLISDTKRNATRLFTLKAGANDKFCRQRDRTFKVNMQAYLQYPRTSGFSMRFTTTEQPDWDASYVFLHAEDSRAADWCVDLHFATVDDKEVLCGVGLDYDPAAHPGFVWLFTNDARQQAEINALARARIFADLRASRLPQPQKIKRRAVSATSDATGVWASTNSPSTQK